MAGVRLNRVAKELNVGISTLTDTLKSKKPDGEYGPNTKLSAEEFNALLSEHGSGLSAERRQALLDEANGKGGSTTAVPKAPKPAADQHTATEHKGLKIKGKIELDKHGNPVKPQRPEATPTATSAPKGGAAPQPVNTKPEQAATPAASAAVVTPSPSTLAETPTVEAKEPASKAHGVASTAPQYSSTDTPAASAAPQQPASQEPKPQHLNGAAAPQDTPADKEATQQKEPAHVSTDKPIERTSTTTAPTKSDTAADTSTTTKKEKKDGQFIPITTELSGPKVIGKVDLSTIRDTDSRRGHGEKRSRKRIKGGKVDIDKQAQQGGKGDAKGGSGRSTAKKGDTAQPNRGDNKKGLRTSPNAPAAKGGAQPQEQKKGRKAQQAARKQQAAAGQKTEITQEDVRRKLKETEAAMQRRRQGAAPQGGVGRRALSDQKRRERERANEQVEDKKLQLTEYVTANDLAQMIDIPVNDIIMLCFNLGMMVSINQRLEKETIDLVLDEYGYEAEYVEAQMLDRIETEADNEEDLKPRAPIVTVMGHVDHGKTSLLDAIRNTNVIDGEAGGITQHVGAYSVKLEDGRRITFLDTPGHEAFTAMRARGAKVTDVAVILIAADDGVMPQTKEAISHASLAGVPMVFAINKIDKQGADPERVKQQLAELNYLVEDWGGKYQSQEIAAKKGIGIQELLEKVLLEAELLELKANPDKKAVGSVLESTMEQGRGYTTKVLVLEGTLHIGDYILAGSNYGRVKALFNEHGKNVKQVGPSEPVKVLGLNGATQAGEVLNVLDTEAEARDIATKRMQLKREQKERTQRRPSLMDIGRRIAEGKVKELNIIVKGDMDGTVEALSDSVEKLSTDEVRVNVIYKAVGQISESDVVLASASDAIIIGFQVRPAQGAKRLAEEEDVEIRTYSIIYDALDDVKTAMEGLLSPELKERVTANLEVRETFKITKVGTIAGCFVNEGKVSRNDRVRVIRDGVVIHTGALESLKRFKDDAKEVVAGLECGLNIVNFNDIQAGDIIEAFEEIEVKRTL